MQITSISTLLSANTYPGRGIALGTTPSGKYAFIAYFIMGRSVNSRNRVFVSQPDGGIITKAFDESKMSDPSLIIYAPVRVPSKGTWIVTNGDQTDTIRDFLLCGSTFEAALDTRTFEPDGPNWTPRISGILYLGSGMLRYKLNILKSLDAEGSDCVRETFSYTAKPGLGHFLHTYVTDGNPIPTFQGEPERIEIPACVNCLTEEIWNSLDENNRISLYVRTVDLETGETAERLINRNA